MCGRVSLLALCILALATTAAAQSNGSAGGAGTGGGQGGEDPPNFFEVQQYDQPFAGWAEPTLWTTYVASSTRRYDHYDRDLPRDGLVAHSAELEYGLTDRLTVGSYFDFIDPRGGGARYTQTRLLARYRFSDRQELFVNPAIYFEYYIPNHGYGDQQLETRFIADKDVGDFRFVANPTISVNTTGGEAGHQPSIGLSGGVYWRRPAVFQPGLEYYAEYGAWNHATQTKQYLLPTVDIALTPNITWHTGAGFGLTHDSDRFVLESQLRFEFNVIRPSHLFGRR